MIQSASSITSNSLKDSSVLSSALASASALSTVFPATSIGAQLQQVAKILQVRSALGLSRQVFFCSLGGFDTHANQISIQDTLYSQLSPALAAFYSATTELGVTQDVTTFTMSDFSRTYQPATDGGTDHAWGSVQMILGGAVKGWRHLRNFAGVRAGRAERCGQQRPLDSDDGNRPVWRDVGDVVWRAGVRAARNFPEPGKLHHAKAGLSWLN